MKLILAIAGLFLTVAVSAARAGKGERIPAPAAAAEEKPAAPVFCDTIDAKLAACRVTDPKKLKKAAFPVTETAAVKKKRKDAGAKLAKARELCEIVKAERAKAAELRANGDENSEAAALNIERQANLVEKTASVLLDEALQLLNEIGECPTWKAPPVAGKTRLKK